MRREDVAEVLALGFQDARTAVWHSLSQSTVAFALLFDGEVAAVFGVGRAENGVACVWALTGRAVHVHPRAFIRASRPILHMLLSECGVLCNVVDARYEASVRWLRWLGFSVGPAIPIGPEGIPFHPISIRQEDVSWAR